jgi:hypothetical protein
MGSIAGTTLNLDGNVMVADPTSFGLDEVGDCAEDEQRNLSQLQRHMLNEDKEKTRNKLLQSVSKRCSGPTSLAKMVGGVRWEEVENKVLQTTGLPGE